MTTDPSLLYNAKSLTINVTEILSEKDIKEEISPSREEDNAPIVETPVVEDETYFLRSSFIFLQVENTLFQVPSYRFTNESQIFAETFKLPQVDKANVEGASREHPIVLPDNISLVEFRNFLKALYPLPVAVTLSLSKAEWLSVLKLSSLWFFLRFRKMAIAELERTEALTPAEKVSRGRDFKISSWVIKGCKEITQRTPTISKDEVLALGYETAFSLFRLREQRIEDDARGMSRAASTIDPVEEAFKDEVESIRLEEKKYAPKEAKGNVGGTTSGCTCADVEIDNGAKGTPSAGKAKKNHRR